MIKGGGKDLFKGSKKKSINKKKLPLFAKAAIIAIPLIIAIIAATAFGGFAFFLTLGGVLPSRFWNAKDDEIPHASEDCECGCIWILDDEDGQSQTVTDVEQTVVDSDGNVDTSSLKLLGTAEMSYYSFDDNDDGAGNFGTAKTSSGAYATPGITVAMADKYTISGGDIMEKLWLELGDWIYIENIGVRQIQDRCGTSGRVDVYVDDSDADIKKYSGSILKIYMVKEGSLSDIKQGSQDGVVPPTVTSKTTTVPSYGYTTGSTTNTSITIPTFKNGKQLEDVLANFLPAAVVNYQVFNIFPSTTIAQKIQESSWSPNPIETHNYHGLKADSSWKGKKSLEQTKEDDGTGNQYAITDYFRVYDSLEEGVLGYGGFLNDNSRYREHGLFEAKTGLEQAKAIFDAGYATDIAYYNSVSSLIKYNDLMWFDDLSNAIYYMQERGIYDKYLKIVDELKNGELQVSDTIDMSGLGEIKAPSNTENQESTDGSGGHWECECKKPCPYCSCHDEETEADGDKGSGAGMTFPEETPGQASGLWGTTEELKGYIAALNDSNMPLNVTQLETLKSNLNMLLADMGKKPATQYTYKTDKFLGPDGWGFVVYDQASSSSNEPFVRKSYNDGTTRTFGSSGCGLYALANALSTLEKKWVSPAEVVIALQTYGVRNNTRISTTKMGNSGAAFISGLYMLAKEAGYTDITLDAYAAPNKDKIDKCLNAGGLVVYVSTDSRVTGNAHYVVIRERASSGNYYLGDSVNHNDTEFTYSSIENSYSSGDGFLYIYPKEGESIEDRKANANKGKEDGNNSSNQISTSEPIGNTGIISYRLDGKMDPLTSPWFRNSPGSYPYNAFHGAADYGAIYQDLVSIFDDGTVTRVDYNDGGYGKYVVIYYSNGLYVLYAHMSEILVSVGQKLTKGEHIGKSGETGAGTGPHLHLQVMVRGGYRAGNSGESFVIDAQALYAGYAIEQCKVRLYGYKTLGAVVRDGIEIGKPIQQAELFEAPYTGGETIDGQ